MARPPLFLLLSLGVALPVSGLAEGLTAEQLAAIRHDEQKAQAEVSAAHGNKPSSELSSAERKEMIQQQQEASRKVMEAHGVSAKDYARQTARMGPSGNAQVAAAQKALEALDKAARKPGGTGEIPIQRGFDENNPPPLEEQDGPPPVEVGMPTDEPAAAGGEQALPQVETASAAELNKATEVPKAATRSAKGGHKKKK